MPFGASRARGFQEKRSQRFPSLLRGCGSSFDAIAALAGFLGYGLKEWAVLQVFGGLCRVGVGLGSEGLDFGWPLLMPSVMAWVSCE